MLTLVSKHNLLKEFHVEFPEIYIKFYLNSLKFGIWNLLQCLEIPEKLKTSMNLNSPHFQWYIQVFLQWLLILTLIWKLHDPIYPLSSAIARFWWNFNYYASVCLRFLPMPTQKKKVPEALERQFSEASLPLLLASVVPNGTLSKCESKTNRHYIRKIGFGWECGAYLTSQIFYFSQTIRWFFFLLFILKKTCTLYMSID